MARGPLPGRRLQDGRRERAAVPPRLDDPADGRRESPSAGSPPPAAAPRCAAPARCPASRGAPTGPPAGPTHTDAPRGPDRAGGPLRPGYEARCAGSEAVGGRDPGSADAGAAESAPELANARTEGGKTALHRGRSPERRRWQPRPARRPAAAARHPPAGSHRSRAPGGEVPGAGPKLRRSRPERGSPDGPARRNPTAPGRPR